MSVLINQTKCICCKSCLNICPGNLIRINETGKAFIKNNSDCWHCMACIKECPVNAISLTLPPELEGRGGVLSVKSRENFIEWTITKSDGKNIVLVTNSDEANNY